MQEFFMNHGLWLLVGLLVVIGLVFLVSSGRKAEPTVAQDTPPDSLPEPVAIAPVMASPVMKPTPPVDVAPAPIVVQASPALPSSDAGDDLMKMKGVGAKLNMLLIELGITRYDQIAGWSEADIAAIDERLGAFKGRPVRDQWVDQARFLAAGDIAGYAARYGKI